MASIASLEFKSEFEGHATTRAAVAEAVAAGPTGRQPHLERRTTSTAAFYGADSEEDSKEGRMRPRRSTTSCTHR